MSLLTQADNNYDPLIPAISRTLTYNTSFKITVRTDKTKLEYLRILQSSQGYFSFFLTIIHYFLTENPKSIRL